MIYFDLTRLSRRILVFVALISVVTSVAAGAATASGQPDAASPAASPDTEPGFSVSQVDPDAAAAMAHQKGITIAEARARLAREQALATLGARIEKSLAGHSGGIYLDANGNLVVTTLDRASNARVNKSGARAKLVDDSAARLDAIMERLGQEAAERGVGAVQDWYVDVPTNTVVVTVTAGAFDTRTAAMLKLAARFGDSVRVDPQPAAQAPRPAAEWLVGGFEFVPPSGGFCSIGFNTLDAYNRNVVLTAGHCVTTSGGVSRNGYLIGQTWTANYPTDDFGTFSNSYPSYWQPSPSVYKYNGTYTRVVGQWNSPPVGATVCKSGRTTGYTCGTIKALNQTVAYRGGYLLYGLVRHDACVEPGDSGGANITPSGFALGVTSGAGTVSETDTRCLSKIGRANVSWFQPIGEALSMNGLRLLL